MFSYARVLCNSAREVLARATVEALDPRLLRRPLACSWRLLSKSTAVVARSLILESAQHELEHLAVIARVYVSLSLSPSLSALSLRLSLRLLSLRLLSLRLSPRLLSLRLSLRLCLRLLSLSTFPLSTSPSLCVFFGRTPRLGLRLFARLSSFQPQPQLVATSALLAQSTEVDHDSCCLSVRHSTDARIPATFDMCWWLAAFIRFCTTSAAAFIHHSSTHLLPRPWFLNTARHTRVCRSLKSKQPLDLVG